MTTVAPVLEIDGLCVEFATDDGPVRAVDGVSIALAPGERVAVVGESGSGKTVTALAIMGLIDAPGRITAGDVRLDGRSLRGISEDDYRQIRGRDVAMIFQDPMTALNPAMRIGPQVAEAITVHDSSVSRATASARAIEQLDEVGIASAARRARDYPHQLSGGMRQRVLIAMALANRPRVLIADEPTTALDVTTQAQILELLGSIGRDRELAVVLVTHDLGVVAGHADRVMVMYAGRVVEEGTVDDVFASPRHPYTRGLLAAVPTVSRARGALTAIPGSPPNLLDVPEGMRVPSALSRTRRTGAGRRCHLSASWRRTIGRPASVRRNCDGAARGRRRGQALPCARREGGARGRRRDASRWRAARRSRSWASRAAGSRRSRGWCCGWSSRLRARSASPAVACRWCSRTRTRRSIPA